MAALASAGLRCAAALGARGLERIVAAAVIATVLGLAEALALGLVALGASPVALGIAAGLTWLAARAALPRPEPGPWEELVAWWDARSAVERVAAGAVAGVFAAWTVWLLRTPALGVDSLVYHLPEALDWIHNGRTGSIETVFPGLPVGNYPLAAEVTAAWGMGIARSFVPVVLIAPALVALLGASAWAGLRRLGVPAAIAGIAAAVLCVTPTLTVYQQYGAQTDLPALAWLVAAGCLAAASLERPALAGAALAAIGLAIGSKTTTLPVAGLLLLALLWAHRSRLARPPLPLVLGAAGFLAVGLIWYLRNLVLHGSPLFPFVAAPWGDPVPEGVLAEPNNVRFVKVPGETLDRLGDEYVRLLSGSLVVLAAGLLAWLVDRRREVVAASAVVALGVVLWTFGPLTGVSVRGLDAIVASSVRYLLPATAVAVLAIALAGRRPGLPRALAAAALGVAIVWNLVRIRSFGSPSVPSAAVPLAGAVAGALAGLLLARLPLPARLPAVAAPALMVAAGVALAPLASGFIARHAEAGLVDSGLIAFVAGDERHRDGEEPISVIPTHIAPLAGDRLQHELRLVPEDAACPELERRLARGDWVVMRRDAPTGSYRARDCLRERTPAYEDAVFRVHAPERP